ncbi:MAG: hypothetical protein ACRC57_13380 [Sarcina sp.]
MSNNFISGAYYANNILLIEFNCKMCTLGTHSILESANYSISSKCTNNRIILKNYVTKILDFNDSFISFSTTNEFTNLFTNDIFLIAGNIEIKKINYVLTLDNLLCDFVCSTKIINDMQVSSLENCTLSLIDDYKIIVNDNNDIKFNKLFIDDFFVKINFSIIDIVSISRICHNSFEITIPSNIVQSYTDTINLCTKDNIKSFDNLKRPIKANTCVSASNELKTTLLNLSVFSYENSTLTIALTFNNPILRFDANDFYIFINGLRVPSSTKLRYINKNIVFVELHKICFFSPNAFCIKVSKIQKEFYYTVDTKLKYIEYFSKTKKSAVIANFSSISLTNDSSVAVLTTLFTDILKNISMQTQNLIPHLNEDSSILTLQISNFAKINIYGKNLSATVFSQNPECIISSKDNSFIINFATAILAYISENANYMDFKPLYAIVSQDNTIAYSSFEIPVNFELSNSITCDVTNYGDSWSLLGKNIYLPTTIIVDKSVVTRDYGNSNIYTTFNSDIYIKEQYTGLVSTPVYIKFINITAKKVYSHLHLNYNVEFINSSIEDLIILDEDI